MSRRRRMSRQNRRFRSVKPVLKRTVGIALDSILSIIFQALLALILSWLSC